MASLQGLVVLLAMVATIHGFSCPWFHCDNRRRCIAYSFRCNGHRECSDGSDERRCGSCRRGSGAFLCSSRQCIQSSDRCDGTRDCTDGSDETGCSSCQSGGFLCSNGQCIQPSDRCNGTRDCTDGSDEAGCSCPFSCDSGQCVSFSVRCNGYTDGCTDGSDERGCASCQSGAFRCNNGQCIRSSVRCNGTRECTDGSDETGCPYCNGGAFLCSRSSGSLGQTQIRWCIPSTDRCDGIQTPGCSDELRCTNCSSGAFLCTSRQCIRSTDRCDGTQDCTDGSDETGCSTCSNGAFLCNNGQCIQSNQRCDGRLDCSDTSDERGCFGLRCLPQAIANLTANIEVQCSITTNDVITGAVCVYDDQPAEECDLTFVIERDRFALGNHAVTINVSDARGASELLTIPFQRLPPPPDLRCSLDRVPSGPPSISCTSNNVLSRAPFCQYDGGAFSVQCSNTQARSFTVDVPHSIGFGSHSVTISITDVFAQSSSATLQFEIIAQNGDLRLSRGSLLGPNYTSGRLEIYINEQWGTVCSDSFSIFDAHVACRQLGFTAASRGPIISSSRSLFGSGSGQIWLDDVRCSGGETCLLSCSNRGIGSHNCNHSEDVAIFCFGPRTPNRDCTFIDTATPTIPGAPAVVNNLVGAAVGGSVAAFVLFVVIPIVTCVVIGLCVATRMRAGASSSKQVTTSPAPTAATANAAGTQKSAYPLATDTQSYPTDIKQDLTSAPPEEMEMQDQQKDHPYQPQKIYPPSLQDGYPPQ